MKNKILKMFLSVLILITGVVAFMGLTLLFEKYMEEVTFTIVGLIILCCVAAVLYYIYKGLGNLKFFK